MARFEREAKLIANVTSGELRQLTEHSALDINPFFSPDGTELKRLTTRTSASTIRCGRRMAEGIAPVR